VNRDVAPVAAAAFMLFAAPFVAPAARFASPFASIVRAADEPLVLSSHRAGVTGVDFSPDGDSIASSSLDGTVRVWDSRTGELADELKHGAEVYAVAFSPAGNVVASSGLDGRIVFWNLDSGESRSVTLPDWSVAIAFTADGDLLVGSTDGKVRLVAASDGQVQRTLDAGGEVLGLAVSADGRRVATGVPIKLWDLESGKPVPGPGGYGQGGVAFSPDGNLLASGEWTGGARVWNAADSKSSVLLRIDVERQGVAPAGFAPFTVNMPVTSVEFSADGTRLATGATDRAVQLWEVKDGRVATTAQRVLEGHSMTVTSVSFAPDGKHLASGSLDRTVRVWPLP